MSTDLVIRPAVAADADRIKAITIDGFERAGVDAAIDRRWPDLLPVPWPERKWRGMQHEVAGETCYVAELAGEVAGYITIGINHELSVGRIPNLAVDAALRGQGIGRRLIDHALALFRAEGLRLARIETLASNEVGRHLYPSTGFEEVAMQVHFAMSLDHTPAPAAGK